ncbi:ATP-binding protein [Aeoliella sp. ICT_H6.2]|uniref:histidine kinase n=1 Tax=Aeoliella straminimaris TaxID=2954799 RepID=A0A9X2JIZ5_9BACT|nr:ATP-binding protein [Aeoliella straminimaris]MCO6047620.1 ATP-binding protein [Aeoliella straminimaris]
MKSVTLNERVLSPLSSYGVAVLTTGLAVWARYGLNPQLQEECPFSLFYLSVLVTAWIAGTGPAFLAVVLGTCSAAYFFIGHQSSITIDSVSDIVQLSIYVLVNSTAALLFDRLRRQRRLAEQRSRDNERLSNSLREADERKDEFLALLAHELRNPLAPIRSGLEMLRRESQNAELIDRVRGIIERQTNHLVRLTNDLLDVSRFSRGKLELQMERFDLRLAVSDAIEMTAGQIAERSHRFEQLSPDSPVWIEGDRVRLAQMTANLLGNAAKYTPSEGCIVLEIEPQADRISIAVRDNGIGFPPNEAGNILMPFRQIDTSRTRAYGGLGLGLSIVRRIAELHGGQLEAFSRGPGRGSCFTVWLPMAPADATTASEAAPESKPIADESRHDGTTRSQLSVLLAEDGTDAADLLRELLEAEGYAVQLARDGVSAVQLAVSQLPDVCVLDIGLPGMDGFEVARRIRRMDHDRRIRLIAVTGWGSDADREMSREAGFDCHLVKPIIYSELLAEIEAPSPQLEEKRLQFASSDFAG